MGSLAVELISGARSGAPLHPGHVLLVMMLVALLSSGLQILYGVIGGGTLIKYIPYPVVTGYLSGVGIVIFLKQLPGFLGLPKDVHGAHGLAAPGLWNTTSLLVGLATVVVMVLAPHITKKVPAAILGLVGGGAAYLALSMARPGLRVIEGNTLLIGRLGGGDGSFVSAFAERFAAFREASLADLQLGSLR